jgi:hypothetical protein
MAVLRKAERTSVKSVGNSMSVHKRSGKVCGGTQTERRERRF